MIKHYLLIFLVLMLISSESVFAQSLSVNRMNLNEYYRRQQLLGNLDSTIAFTFRPLFSEALNTDNIYDPDNSLDAIRKSSFDGIYKFHKEKGKFQILPISLLTQYNSHHPEGTNDASMIPSKGTQLKASAGFYFKYSLLSIKFNPEFVYAQNEPYDGFPQNYVTNIGIRFPKAPYLGGSIDLPDRFGESAYHKLFLGQSNMRLNYKSISLGASSENLWWGPGYKNSLLMTNSAPGFLHLTLNTVRPIRTPIGSFEGQLIGGKLDASGYTPNLKGDWRYLNAITLSYQPRWVPGLFLGMTRSFMVYHSEMGSGMGAYLPVFSLISKSSNGSNEEVNNKNNNQLISVFMRWLFPEAHGEVYFEFGREDHSWDIRDFILEPAHSSAYIFGARKLFFVKNNKDTHIQVIAELANLTSNQTTINRGGGSADRTKAYGGWYLHTKVKHGYTNEGQLLGAGIGPSSNTQTLHVSWNQNLKQIGIEFERYVHNNDFWYNYIRDFRSNWVDQSATLFANWTYKHFLLYGKTKFVRSKNYQWLYEPPLENIQDYWIPADDIFNFQLQLGITYRF